MRYDYANRLLILLLKKSGVNIIRATDLLRSLKLFSSTKEAHDEIRWTWENERLLYDGSTILIRLEHGEYMLAFREKSESEDLDYSKLPVFQAMEVKRTIENWDSL